MNKCKCCALFIAIYSAVISSVFVMPLRDHCFPRTAPPHMLIRCNRGVKLCTLTLGVDNLCQWQWPRSYWCGQNWREDCRIIIWDLLSLFEYIIIAQSNTSLSRCTFFILQNYIRSGGDIYCIGGMS